MRLSMLAGEGARILGAGDTEVGGLTADSRKVRAGDLFAALPGSRTDGRRFVAEAVARGAVAVLGDEAVEPWADRVNLVIDDNPRRRFAQMASRFYDRQPEQVIAVTGTNGKTSVASFLRQIWEIAGLPAASLGTLGVEPARLGISCSLTTPDPVSLHEACTALADAGVTRLVVEASSHGLAQYRLDGLTVTAAAFTNLSRDHFDYHGDRDSYFYAKARLFSELLRTGGYAVLNADVPEFDQLARICRQRGIEVIDYGRRAQDLVLLELLPGEEGIVLKFACRGEAQSVTLPLFGPFQAHNVLAALGLAIASGLAAAVAADVLTGLVGVPGRMQRIARRGDGAMAFVDYAHTPDALEKALEALRAHLRGRLVVVFGCGGDRDRGKRPEMGRIAERLADRVIVTDDNPRTEDPAAIRAEILAGIHGGGALEIGDRAEAIARGWAMLDAGDALLVAGKGHEKGQILGDTVLPFDDAEVLRSLAAEDDG